MAEVAWRGDAGGQTAQRQIKTFTPATIEATDAFVLTATGEDATTLAVSIAASDTSATTTSGLSIAAWNASTHRLATPITASGTATVILTADTAGVPFSVAGTTVDHGGANTQTFVGVDTQSNIGASDAALGANYYNNAVPSNSGDNFTIDGRSQAAISYSLNQSGITATLARVTMANTYNVGSTVGYFRMSATTLKIGEAPGDGSTPSGPNLIAWDTGTNASTQYVYNSNSTGTNGLPTVNLKGTHASNVLYVLGGKVGVATLLPGDTSTYATITQEGGALTLASGLTLTTLNLNGGDATVNCAATTVNQDGGTLKTRGTGAITTVNCAGPADFQSTGTITTLNVRTGGTASFGGSPASRTITTINLYAGAVLDLDCGIAGIPIITNPINLINCALADVTIKTAKHITIAIAAGS